MLALGDMVFLPSKCLFLRDISTLVFADTHIGIEFALADEAGAFIPPVQFRRILSAVLSEVERWRPRRIVINGDLKHKFERRTAQEHVEVSRMLSALEGRAELILVRGNHDTFVRGSWRSTGSTS